MTGRARRQQRRRARQWQWKTCIDRWGRVYSRLEFRGRETDGLGRGGVYIPRVFGVWWGPL